MMKIVKLTVENFMKLYAVEIEPDGHTVIISGKNGAGKSSALNSIWAVFEWAQASKKIKTPIRDGESRAEIRIDLGEFIATRTFTEKGTILKIQSADGATYPSPQAFVDKLKGALSFDPLAFTALPEKEQAATLRDLLGIDTTALDEQRATLYEARANWNRQAKERAGALKTHPGAWEPGDDPVHDAEISVSGLMAELEEAEKERGINDILRDSLKEMKRMTDEHAARISNIGQEIALLEAKLDELLMVRANLDVEAVELTKQVDALADPDTASIKARIASADATNKAVRARKDFQLVESQKIEAESNAAKITAKMEAIDAEKKELVANADFPIDGLGFDETGVTFDGMPFAQASSAEQLRVSLAMAMALNPTLRVIRITDGSLLDSENLALIQEMADAEKFQIWIEKVDETGKIGVYIEDGQVVEMAEGK